MKVLIIQPALPKYRTDFFDQLKLHAAKRGIDIYLLYGDSKLHKQRNDQSSLEWATKVQTVGFGVRNDKKLSMKFLFRELHRIRPDFVIQEQAIKNLEVLPVLFLGPIFGYKAGWWGHGKSYSTKESPLAAFIKQKVTHLGSWFFAYTLGGKSHLVAKGFNSKQITVVQNTFDTERLSRELTTLDHQQLADFINLHRLTTGKVGLFLGGIDEAKGIPWLIEASKRIKSLCPEFQLLIGGQGNLEHYVEECRKEGAPIVSLGRLDGRNKAIALKVSDILLIPEWVGLVAVDSLLSGVPILTTDDDRHSPEFEYLTPCQTCIVTKHDLDEYADSAAFLLENDSQRKFLTENLLKESGNYTLTTMVNNFTDGLSAWISEKGKPSRNG